MNLELVGEPSVSAFLRSVDSNLTDISWLEPAEASYYSCPGLKKDLGELKNKLEWFQGLVVDGDAKRLADRSVDRWMDDLNDLLYHVEDILDDVKRLWKAQVCDNDLKSFSDDINNRFQKILDRTEELRVGAKDLELKRGSGHDSSAEWKLTMRTRETSSMVDISKIHGREKDQTHIVNRVLEVNGERKEKYDVIGVWGMGGLGKTTLAQLVFNDPEVVKHFEVRRWVCISDVFDVRKTVQGLIGDDSAGDAESLQSLHQRLQNVITNERFLFVLDDVWPSTEWNQKWDMIKAPFNLCQNGSKIVVTTRNCNIAQNFGDKKPYQLEGLPHEQCMLIFKDSAGVNDGEKEKLMIWGDKIVKACKGLPLAVKVIGSMLQTEKEEKWRAVSENTDLWETSKIKDGIHPAIRLSYHYLPASLKRCFQYLAVFPPDHYFRQYDVVRMWIAEGLVEEEEGRRVEDIGNEYYNELKARSLIQDKDMMHDIVQHLATVMSRKFCYKENSKEHPASVRHAFLVNWNSMHYEFLAQAPYLRTLIHKTVHRNTNASWKMLRTLKIISPQNYPLGESSTCHLTHLRYLSIYALKSRHLLDSVCMLDNLRFLVLSCMDFKELPKDIGNLRNLRELDLNCSSISSLPESICSLCQLLDLNLSYCRSLKELPEDIGNLRSLRTLDLRDSSISSLPESICALCELKVLDLNGCGSLKQLPIDIGNLRSLKTLDLLATSILSVPESISNVIGLQNLLVSESNQLPLYIGRLERLEKLPNYHVSNEEGRRLGELNRMNRLKGELTIARMENIRGVEEAKMADLKSKKFIEELKFQWSQGGNDEEMEVKIMEALEPYHALESLTFFGYGGNKFPAWMMAGNICFSNLTQLEMDGLEKVCDMVDMEFVLLERLQIINCPKLKKVIMATPKLVNLCIVYCEELEADSVHLLSSLSDKLGLLSIVSELQELVCPYNIFEYFLEKLETANSKWDKLLSIALSGGGRRVASLPAGWPSIMNCIESIQIVDIGHGMFQFVPDGDQSPFPPSLTSININSCGEKMHDPHHWYTITSEWEVEKEEESTDCEEESMDCEDESIDNHDMDWV